MPIKNYTTKVPAVQTVVGKAAGENFTVNAPAGSFTMKVVSVSREG